MSIEKNILRILEEINESQKSIINSIELNEAATLSPPLDSLQVTSPFGPRWGTQHTGVDLAASSANVKSPADGVVSYIAADEYPCGGTIKIDHPGGYTSGYCHMKKINVQRGQSIRQGDIIGISGGGKSDPGKGRSDGPHLHFTLRKDDVLVDPMKFLGKEGIVSNTSVTNSKESSSTQSSEDAYKYATSDKSSPNTDSKFTSVVGDVKSAQGFLYEEIQEIINIYESILSNSFVKNNSVSLNEQRNFGKNISNRYGSIIIPKEDNSKIKSPISGKITSRYSPGCVNPVLIENTDDKTIYLQYCGISSPSVRIGQSIKIGDEIGKTNTDVRVEMFDYKFSRLYIPEKDLKIDKKGEDEIKKKTTSEPEYYDPLMAAILGLPSKILQDTFDKDGNRTEKRYGGVADKQEVDPFILNFLKDPFKRKKVNENIERIKKML